MPLDVTDADSIAAAIAEAGPLDALVNNAGVGMLNVLEGAEIARARELLETTRQRARDLLRTQRRGADGHGHA